MRHPIFAGLWIATLLNYIGTAARDNAASVWLIKELTEGRHNQPVFVGYITTAGTLPLALLSVFAGTLADLFDRRRLLILTQIWMIVISILLAFCTWIGWISPWGLLGLTVLLALGTAASNPAFQAVLPELVPPKDISLAMGLNSVALNLARAAGPAMFGIAVWLWKGRTGIVASYTLIAFIFIAVAVVLCLWKRPPERAAVHGERFWGSLKSGLQYTAHSRANVAVLLRVLTFILPSVALWSQLPILAKQVHADSTGFSILLVSVGGGAIFGVFMMQDLQRRFSIDGAVNGCTAMFAIGLVLLSQVTHAWLADLVMFFLGINWVIIPTNFNVATQTSVPAWVKGRALSMYLTVLWGSFAIGGAVWGHVTEAHHLSTSLMTAGIVMGVLLLLAKWFPLTLNAGQDLSPALKGGASLPADLPMVLNHRADGVGQVHVSISYELQPAARAEFLQAAHDVGKHRRRNGASTWRIEQSNHANGGPSSLIYVERFSFLTAGECARQPARMTAADVEQLTRLRQLHSGAQAPVIAVDSAAHAPTGQWWKNMIYRCIDRTLEEIENAFIRSDKIHGRR